VEHDFFSENTPNWVYFGQCEDFKLTTEQSEKVRYSRNQAIKNSLNEAILLMSINETLLSRVNLASFKHATKTLFCMKVIRIFNAQPVKIPYFNTPLARKQAR